MLAGMGANFLYTAISRCKVPPDILSIYMVIRTATGLASKVAVGDWRSRRALTFWRASAGLLNGAL
jgi:hypothetical protein